MSTGAATPEVGRTPGMWTWLAAWASVLPLAAFRAGNLSESDTFWQVRAGELILSGAGFPRTDSWSWTATGEPWTMNSWGFNVLLGAANLVGGLPLVALGCAGLAAVAMAVVVVLARRLAASPPITAVLLTVTFALVLGWLSARPQLVDYLAVPVLVLLLREVVDGPRPRLAAALCVLLAGVWMNLHAAALLGVVVAAGVGLVLVVRSATRARGWLALATAAAMALATLATPYGLAGYAQAGSVRDASAGVITEWASLNVADPVQLGCVLIGLAGLVVALRRGEIVLAVALAVTTVGGVVAIRLLPIAVIVAVAPLAAALSSPRLLHRLSGLRAVTVPAAALWLVLACWLAVGALAHPGRPDASLYSAEAVNRIPPGCRVVNTYLVGGYLGLLRPDVLVSIDSRNDLFGVDRVLAATELVEARGDVDAQLAGAGCVLMPTSSPLAQRLAVDPAWKQSAQDSIQLLFVRR